LAGLSDKWRGLQEELGRPVNLSEREKEKLKGIFKKMHDLLNENLEAILEGSRDDAYRYADLLIQAFSQVDLDYAKGIEPEELPRVPKPVNLEPPQTAKRQPRATAVKPGERPSFHAIFDSLTSVQQEKAKRLLDCVKTALDLEEAGENPDQILCHEPDRSCSAEEMKKCIQIADPSIVDDMDRGLQDRRREV
jgi:hypothetical protein